MVGIVLAYWFDNWTDTGALQCHEECTKNEWKWGCSRCRADEIDVFVKLQGPAASSIQVAV